MPILRLAIPGPLRSLFDYLPPDGWNSEDLAQLSPGIRIKVPFGHRSSIGILVEQVQESELASDKLRVASKILDSQPLINRPLMQLCQWATHYYKHPPGEVLSIALPPPLREGKLYQPPGEACWQLTSAGMGLPRGALKQARRQAQVIAALQDNSRVSHAGLKAQGISATVLKQLLEKGLIESLKQPVTPRLAATKPGLNLALNPEQHAAVDAVSGDLGKFHCSLLEGVTGSGKTEVYLRLISEVLARGEQALVLVPEIGLTPQTLQRFQRRFEANIVVLHSGLTNTARQRAWDEARCGLAHIVLGTRSAAFSCLANPGIIIVDEEHDPSFKQQDGFRYSARDIAVKRGQIDKVPVLLGSATPSLESLSNAVAGRYRHLALKQRASRAELPGFEVLDIRRQRLQGGISDTLAAQVQLEIEARNQVLLFLNRRGYAPTLQCHDCGFIASCRNCDARLTLHKRLSQLRCHHCGWATPAMSRCPQCQSGQLGISGVGTEQVESTLQKLFPDTPLYRVDRDSMSRVGAMEKIFMAVSAGDPCILIGTQMLSKGHHFPNVTLVGLIDADTGLFSGDFRGPERMGQLLTQVAGRAGRAEKPGRVLLQTHYPDHPALGTLLEQGYGGFARALCQHRQAAGMPPYGHLVLVRAEAGTPHLPEQFLARLRGVCEEDAQFNLQLDVHCIGPLPAPVQRLRNRYRAQLLLVAKSRRSAQRSAARLVLQAQVLDTSRRVRWSVDVDPQDMM